MFLSIYLFACFIMVTDPVTWVYTYHAESGRPPDEAGWSSPTDLRIITAKRTYLGPFTNTSISIDPGLLPEHDTLVVSFTVYILGSWDGVADGDALTVIIDDADTIVHTTFSNTTFAQNHPDVMGGRRYPRRTGADEVDVTGWTFTEPNVFNGPLDAAYMFTVRRPHGSRSCRIRFTGSLRDVRPLPANEAWGIDDVHIGVVQRVMTVPNDEPAVVPGR